MLFVKAKLGDTHAHAHNIVFVHVHTCTPNAATSCTEEERGGCTYVAHI